MPGSVRTQRAIAPAQSQQDVASSAHVEKKTLPLPAAAPANYQKVEFHFPKPEFGGFVPVRSAHGSSNDFFQPTPRTVESAEADDRATFGYEIAVPALRRRDRVSLTAPEI